MKNRSQHLSRKLCITTICLADAAPGASLGRRWCCHKATWALAAEVCSNCGRWLQNGLDLQVTTLAGWRAIFLHLQHSNQLLWENWPLLLQAWAAGACRHVQQMLVMQACYDIVWATKHSKNKETHQCRLKTWWVARAGCCRLSIVAYILASVKGISLWHSLLTTALPSLHPTQTDERQA